MRRTLSTALAGALILACGSFSADPQDSGGTEAEPPPGSPQENAKPPLDGTPITGVFVSRSKGTPDGDGKMEHPFDTIAAGIAHANGQRVIVCAEEYDENLTLADGVSVYGYFDCTNTSQWKQDGERHATVKAPKSPALVATHLTLPTRVDGFEIDAPDLDATTPDDPSLATSIGALITDCTDLSFGSVTIRAGKGAPGRDGLPGAPNVESGATTGGGGAGQEGNITCVLAVCGRFSGAAGGSSSCAAGGNGGHGGRGGDGMWEIDSCNPPAGYNGSGQTDTPSETAPGGSVRMDGTPGAPGANGQNGDNGVWSIDLGGFHPGDGTAGTIGKPGQGGGGGGGSDAWVDNHQPVCQPSVFEAKTATGAGGGAGGCAGLPGTPGTGGGASIGAFVVNSVVKCDATEIFSSSGGAAGKGSLGSSGLNGGKHGTGTKTSMVLHGDGGNGGDGGPGGWGGISGHGAPGPSIAVAFRGQRPTSETRTLLLNPGPGGAGQPELKVTTPTGDIAIPEVQGESKAEYEF